MPTRLPALVLLLLVPLAGCGSRTVAAAGGPSVRPYDVVALQPDAGDDAPATVAGGRVVDDGTLQLLVEGGSCARPTRTALTPRGDDLAARAFAADVAGGRPCTRQIVPWFVAVAPGTTLDGRTLVDGDSGAPLRVVDCRTVPDAAWCRDAA